MHVSQSDTRNLFDQILGNTSARRDKAAEQEERREAARAAQAQIAMSRELNPNLNPNANSNAPPREDIATVGDGGASWRRKQEQRMRERAQEEAAGARFKRPSMANDHDADDNDRAPVAARRAVVPPLQYQVKRARNNEPTVLPVLPTLPSAGGASAQQSQLSAGDLNKLQAQLMRAEMRGDDDEIARLEALIAGGSAAAAAATTAQPVALAVAFDKQGRPLVQQPQQRKRGHAPETHDRKTGERLRYYADDDAEGGIDELVRREKFAVAGAYDNEYAKNIARGSSKVNVDLELDEVAEQMFESKAPKRRVNDEEMAVKQRHKQAAAARAAESEADKCSRCLAAERAKAYAHTIVARGTRTYLSVPARGAFVEGHCFITPSEHVASVAAAEEDVATELRNFQKCLIRMFAAQNLDVVFCETASSLHRSRHATIECVPMPRRDASAAPSFFRQGLMEAEREDEWAQHKKVIDVPAAKGLRKAVPDNFPYFYVQFGLGDGLLHIIDDRRDFGEQFARGVFTGLLELDPVEQRMRAQRGESREEVAARVARFAAQFKPYDWTAALRVEVELDAINASASSTKQGPALPPPQRSSTASTADNRGIVDRLRDGSRIDS
jgi:hypothetical protein